MGLEWVNGSLHRAAGALRKTSLPWRMREGFAELRKLSLCRVVELWERDGVISYVTR